MLHRVTPSIRILPPELANQIAAGEVVERPASVVKELIENALDAGARKIEVVILGGGIDLIEVSDDGHGMTPENASAALLRHATSKLTAFSDLEDLGSYGFRGEAIPSIASVSRFTLATRALGQESGVSLAVEEGRVEARPHGRPVGTTISVRELFFNVPARRKFLKASGTESAHVGEVVADAALSRPDVMFVFRRDGRLARSFPRARDRAERAMQVLDESGLVLVAGERGPLRVEGYVSSPERSRQGASGLKLIVNGRPVRDRAIAASLAHAYGEALPRGRYPRGVVYLDLPPRLVDINVHPQKLEVRFADPRALLDALHGLTSRALAEPLQARRVAPPETPREGNPAENEATENAPASREERGELPEGRAPRSGVLPRGSWSPGRISSVARSSVAPSQLVRSPLDADAESVLPREAPEAGALFLLGRAQNGYLVCESRRGIAFVDPHALVEVVYHEELRNGLQEGRLPGVSRLFPLRCRLEPSELQLIAEYAESLGTYGFDLRPLTESEVNVFALPLLGGTASPQRCLTKLALALAARSRDGTPRENVLSLALSDFFPELACAASVGSTPGSYEPLLAAYADARHASSCLHGRVIVQEVFHSEVVRRLVRLSDPGGS